ncbi:MAG: N-acetylneuraminate synthase family protein [Tannerella sp.]|jgi:sialic acid synthase SpsE|nr:N-acetylneuraminate synthase family protein [Tannerella sp.]
MKPFNKEIKIGNRLIGKGHPAYIIAEIGANFDNDIDKAKRLIDAAKEAGADCAKFQSFLSDRIVSGKGFASMTLKGVHGTWGRGVDEVFRDAEFPRAWHKELADYCNKTEIHFSSSPYDFEAVDLCVAVGAPYIKIGSGDITWLEMLEYIAKTGKPLFLATGDATMAEIDEAVRTIQGAGCNDLVLMQCITNYPSLVESANINVLRNYKKSFDILTGYSDHSPGSVVVLGSIALGACVIEKHFTLDKKDKGPDHNHSMDMEEFTKMVKDIHLLESAMGSTQKFVVEEESETVIVQRRGLYAKRDIKAGDTIQLEDIDVLRPALGIPPKFRNIIAGKKAVKDIDKGMPIYWESI